MFHDPAAHVAKFEGMGHHGVTVVEQDATDTSLSITITREVDVDGIPGFAKKFLSPRNTVVSVDTWTDNGDGTYSGQYTLDTKGTPIEISGNTRLDPDGDQTIYSVEVDIRVKVPLVGSKLENFAKGIALKQLDQEFELADAWLESH